MAPIVYAVATEEDMSAEVDPTSGTSTETNELTLPEFTGSKFIYLFWPLSRGAFERFEPVPPFNQANWFQEVGLTVIPGGGPYVVLRSATVGYDVLSGFTFTI
ncbi:hypothetical protein [Candidatus Poriferisodalis sp.]|uniref:hypothetical protein n=1 Tax=Candidatus Poriferisodalis sp. TaxID=3101277 RepID=UPI003B02DF61